MMHEISKCFLRSNRIFLSGSNVTSLRCRRKYSGEAVGTMVAPTTIENVTTTSKVVDPLNYPDYFGVSKMFTVRELFEARVHWGHKIGSLRDEMKPFVFGHRLDQTIFDLDQTAFHLRQALNFLAHIAFRKGIILFVSRHRPTVLQVEKAAREVGEYASCREWPDGLFLNMTQEFRGVTRPPDIVVLPNCQTTVMEMHPVISDAAKLLIPTVGVVDSNCNPNLVTYPIPGNDDTGEAIELYLKLFKQAIVSGKQKRKQLDDAGVSIIGAQW